MKTFDNICRYHGLTREKVLSDDFMDNEELYEDLYELWMHEMPYGTAKARSGDPGQWIADRLYEEFGL